MLVKADWVISSTCTRQVSYLHQCPHVRQVKVLGMGPVRPEEGLTSMYRH